MKLKFSFVWNFHNKKYVVFSLSFLGSLKHDCVIKTIDMFNFLPLIKNSFTTGFSFLLLIISASYHQNLLILYISYMDCILQYFHKYFPYHLNIE